MSGERRTLGRQGRRKKRSHTGKKAKRSNGQDGQTIPSTEYGINSAIPRFQYPSRAAGADMKPGSAVQSGVGKGIKRYEKVGKLREFTEHPRTHSKRMVR